MPRPASPLWSHFDKEMPNKRAICKYCGRNMCGLIVRMRAHLARKCENCPPSLKTEMFAEASRLLQRDSSESVAKRPRIEKASVQPQDQTSSQTRVQVEPQPQPEARAEEDTVQGQVQSPASTQVSSQSESTVQVIQTCAPSSPSPSSTSLDDKNDLDGFVARAIFGAGLPLSTVENAAFVKMLKRMSPSYDPPSAFVLATSLLDLEYSELQIKRRAEVLELTSVSIGLETWAASQKRSFVSCVLNSPHPTVFSFESTGEMPHTSEVLVDKIENIMGQIGMDRVSVVVTDTTETMRQASLALESKYPNITFLPSCGYSMNAMVKEMLALPAIANTFDTCKQLARFFAQDDVARAAIARVSEQSMEVAAPMGDPDDASPIGLLDCLFTIERNRHSLDILLAENGTLNGLNSHAKERLISLAYWEEVSTFTGLFEPFHEILKMFESDSPLLSTFYHRFTLLWGHLDKYGNLASKFQRIISGYWHNIQHPAMYTAYLLDPRFPPSSLSGEATSEALAYIKRTSNAETYRTIVDELTRFTARTGLFADDTIWESAQKCSPLHWWKGFIGSSCPNLQTVALRTLSFPASSGLSKNRRDMFEKIQAMNTKYLNEEQANKAAVMYLNANPSSVANV